MKNKRKLDTWTMTITTVNIQKAIVKEKIKPTNNTCTGAGNPPAISLHEVHPLLLKSRTQS